MAIAEDLDKYRAPALDKGLDILELLAGTEDGLSQAEIAKSLDRSPNEIYRMLDRLVRRAYVRRTSADRYELTSITEVAALDSLLKLALDNTKQFTVKDLNLELTDFTLKMPLGVAFVAESANGITAMFIATGQDVANVAESSAGVAYAELTPEKDLYISITIPSLIVATYGGGTGLATQRECLELMGCYGAGKVLKLTEIVAAEGLAQISDVSSLEPLVKKIVAAHPDVIAEIRAGKDRKFQFLVGQVMKETKGKGDPKLVSDLLRAAIGE